MKNNFEIKYKTNIEGNIDVGIFLNKNKELTIALPVGFKEPTENEKNTKTYKEDIKKLMKLLVRKNNIQYKSIYDEYQNNFNLLSAIKVLEDYLEYGLYKQVEKNTEPNKKGRINWKKTINSQHIYMENKIIYNNLYVDNINYFSEKEIQQIQQYCLSTISKIIGFIWDFTYENVPRKFNNAEMIELINRELKRTNQDKKINILKNLLNFIKDVNFDKIEKGEISFKYKEFNYIWQELVDVLGIPKNEKNEYNPKAGYYFWENDVKNDNIKVNPSLPDTVVKGLAEYEEYVFVLDAKYYRISNLPNEYDIFKQTRYGEYVKGILDKKNEQRKIINAFVLPNTLNDKTVEVKNFYAKIEKNCSKIEDYEKIYIVYVDTRKLISYPKEVMYKILNELVNKSNTICDQWY